MDVARKILILSRLAGWHTELSDFTIEHMYPDSLASVSIPEFMSKISCMDHEISQRSSAALAKGYSLRYTARLERTISNQCVIKVGLHEVSRAGPAPVDNDFVSFRSRIYSQVPLVIAGRGAGAECTAAGVFGDIVDLVRNVKV